MANSAALCTSFKAELLKGHHAFDTSVTRGATTADTFKLALFTTAGSLGAGTTAYSTTNELAGTGNYTQGGVTLTGASVATSGTTAYWTPGANAQWTSFTSSAAFDAALLYNSTQSNKSVGVFTFSSQSVTSGTFTLTMPTNDASNALIRLA